MKKRKSDTVSIFSPSLCHEVMGPDAMIFIFSMLSFQSTILFFSFTFKRLFISSSLSAIRVVLSAYLRLRFLPAIFTPARDSSSLAFHMMYSAYKLNKQGDNIQLWYSPVSISRCFPCLVLTVTSCPAYRFLRRQVRWSSIPISWRIFYSLLWSTQSEAFMQSVKQK